MIDVLTDWLRAVGSNAAVLCRSRMSAPWGMHIEQRDEVMFHIVTEGACWLRRPGEPPLRLLEGDLAVVPQGLQHDLADDPASPAEPLEEFLSKPSRLLAATPRTTLVCGVYGSDAQLAHPMLRALPPLVHFPAAVVDRQQPLASTLALLRAELEAPSLGGEALIQHLFDALFVYVIRAWAEQSEPERATWFSALKDPWLSKALARMHAEPAEAWTVQGLAREAGLSRAAFARRFSEQVGEPPLAYLTRWRMGLAARLLHSSEASVAEIADQVGYESEFAFSRAFKRHRGLAPIRFRHEAPSQAGAPLR
ncbi:MAG: helix-turn-helix domain-containing protein [Acidobacteria bacterium]|nr:helix-turn-helix domain-containing protein [Acidobacteriota bacterium]